MSDNFIPLNQSTPVQGKWHNRSQNRYQNNRFQHNGPRRGSFNQNRWGNNSQRNSSYGSDSNNSYGQDSNTSIDAYLHPTMLQDPWAHLRQKNTEAQI